MHSLLEDYLAEVAAQLGPLPPKRRNDELREVQAHLESAVAVQAGAGGVGGRGRVSRFLEQFGPAQVVARGFVAAWRRGENRRSRRIVMKERRSFSWRCKFLTMPLTLVPLAAWLMFNPISRARSSDQRNRHFLPLTLPVTSASQFWRAR